MEDQEKIRTAYCKSNNISMKAYERELWWKNKFRFFPEIYDWENPNKSYLNLYLEIKSNHDPKYVNEKNPGEPEMPKHSKRLKEAETRKKLSILYKLIEDKKEEQKLESPKNLEDYKRYVKQIRERIINFRNEKMPEIKSKIINSKAGPVPF